MAQAGTDGDEVFVGDFETAGAKQRRSRRVQDLHVCPSCSSELVHPTDWAPAAGRRWVVELRCPECEWTGGGTYEQEVVDRFDVALDEGTEAILADLNRLAKANMVEHAERFAAALWDDRILPEDF